MTNPLRVYFDPDEIGDDGYPHAWHHEQHAPDQSNRHPGDGPLLTLPIKDLIRERDGNRCLRCHHPYEKGMGQWSPCDEHCAHGEPIKFMDAGRDYWSLGVIDRFGTTAGQMAAGSAQAVEAEWRILTVHHLNGVKHDCRWWNLVSLCQRCHLTIQAKVRMERPYHREHSVWFKPFVAAYYANVYLGEELTWEQTHERMEELLALEHRQLTIE